MKKFQLSIPTHCHEKWDAMTPENKGRFCGACQKIVIDFSTMSDRQLADFFKKPSGSVCGRLHNDQLGREIPVPQKRIPWVRYFFQFTWPAFVLFLKSCGQKEAVVGNLAVEIPIAKNQAGTPVATLQIIPTGPTNTRSLRTMGDTVALEVIETATFGMVIEVPVDSVARPVPVKKPVVIENKKRCRVQAILNDSAGFSRAPFVFRPVLFQVKEQPAVYEQMLLAGGISVVSVSSKKKHNATKATVQEEKKSAFPSFHIYPNPATANSVVSIKATSLAEGRYVVSLMNGAGAMVQQSFLTIKKENVPFQFALKSLSVGSYFLRLTNNKTGESCTEILVVQ